MRRPLQLAIAGLLVCLALANASPGLFPRGKITTYNYYADLKAGAIEPAPFASQFVLSGLMHVKPELSDSNLKNAFYIMLNVTHALRNGNIQHFQRIPGSTLPLPDAATELNDPFVVVFDDTGKVKSLMVNEGEAEWSRNMKRSIASMLQLDLSSINLNMPIKPHSFLTKENTIYGECSVAYDVHRTPDLAEEAFMVTKIMVPMNCRNFTQYLFNLQGSEGCLIEPQEEMSSASRRVFRIKYIDEDLLIKTLVAHGVINYFPWNFNSEAHYILANQSMELAYMLPVDSENVLPALDIDKMVALDDVTYKKYQTPYVDHAGPNLFENSDSADEISFDGLTKMLEEAHDYLSTNHLEMSAPAMENEQMINRIMNTMSYMNLSNLESFFNHSESNLRARTVFVKMIPLVGTTATCLFARDIIIRRNIDIAEAHELLLSLPFHIRMSTEDLLIEMETLMDLQDTNEMVYKAGVLSFATIIYKTYSHESNRGNKMKQELVDKYVKHYFDRVLSEHNYEMKMVYLHAMKNMEIGGVNKALEPIIRGELSVSEKPEHLRFHAMLVNSKPTEDFQYIHNLYWPILANTNLPLALRICAYAILVNQPPRMERMMNLYWFMVYEKNEHLYNFHYTTLKSLAYTKNSCMRPMAEIARKIFRFTRQRPASGILTSARLFDYENKEFSFGESMNLMMLADELTGSPYAGMIEFKSMQRRKTVKHYTLFLRVEGLDRKFEKMLEDIAVDDGNSPIEKIRATLEKATKDMPPQKQFHVEYALMIHERTVFASAGSNSLAGEKYLKMFSDINFWISVAAKIRNRITFDELFTMQVPNDFGLPTFLRNDIPLMTSIAMNTDAFDPKSPFSTKIELALRFCRHGYHSMEIYNPILKTWHAIRRKSILDISLPIDVNYNYDPIANALKLSLRRLPVTDTSVTGFRSHVQNHVMVIGANEALLENHCSSCRAAELVTRDIAHNRVNTKLIDIDSEDLALHLTFDRYDCERMSSSDPRFDSTDDIFDTKSQSIWENDGFGLMKLAEYRALIFGIPELGSCGYFMKLEPSTVYPASSINIKLRWNKENLHANDSRLVSTETLHFRGTLRVNPVSASKPSLTWNMKSNLDTNKRLRKPQLYIQMSREKPGKDNFQICIKGQKTYPETHADLLKPVNSEQSKIMTKLVITMGETEGSDCVLNDTSITIITRGEIFSAYKEALENFTAPKECEEDMKNHWYLYDENSIVPRTPACLRKAIYYSNLHKFTYDIAYEKIPEYLVPKLQFLSDTMRADLMPYATYSPAHTEPGKMMMTVEHSSDDKLLVIVVRTPTHEVTYDYIPKSNDYAKMMTLDNSQFPQDFIDEIRDGNIKFCTIYPEVLRNTDGLIMPFTLPNKWALLSGDYTGQKFSVFVKLIEPKKLGLLMSFGKNTIQVLPSKKSPVISIDGEVFDYESNSTLPSALEGIQMTWKEEISMLELECPSFSFEWSNSFVSLRMNTELQGQVTGLCGHLDGSHIKRMPRLYTFED